MISYFNTNGNHIDFNKKPICVKIQRVTEDAVEKLERAVSEAHQINQPILPISIDSTGGCAYCLIAMSEIIKRSEIKIATIVESRAMSCGAVLFSCGHQGYRFMNKNAVIMIHDIRTAYSGKVEDVKVDADEANRLNNMMYDMLSDNCGQQKDFFKKMAHANSHADLYLTSEQCLEFNLANHIKVPVLKCNVSINYELC